MLMVSSIVSAQELANSDTNVLGPGEVAIVNGERIPESLFRLYALNATETNPDQLDDETRTQVIENLIYLRLFADEAERLGLDRERRIAAELELQRIQLLAGYMRERHTQENPPTATQIREIYDANLDRLAATRFKTRHIVVDTESIAARLIDELEDGEDFQELARENSTDPTASSGGDLGWITGNSVPASFATALEETAPGEFFSSPVQTQYGWHVILVEETEDAPAPPLDEIRDDLISALASQGIAQLAEELRDAAEVEIVQ
jgi:peptidyl-prolyl cis-trans isomerase C